MLKLFISYSHKDETLVSKFINHIAPLKNSGLISEWYDRKIETGEDFQDDIDNNLNNADIICLMISDSFLASKRALLRKTLHLNYEIERG